jgi:hypothetical protein
MTGVLHRLSTIRNTTWSIDTTGDTWIIAPEGGIYTTGGDGINEVAAALDNTIQVGGVITNNMTAADSPSGIYAGGTRTTVEIANAAIVQGYYGVLMAGSDQQIDNHGQIYGNNDAGFGVYLLGNEGTTFVNNNVVKGHTGVSIIYGINLSNPTGETIVENQKGGVIEGTGTAIYSNLFAGEYINISNAGLIKGASYAFLGHEGNENIVNTGRIIGDIVLGNGNDSVDTRTGRVNGAIYGGGGNDVLMTGNASLQLIEKSGEGLDSIYATADYTLGTNVEQLFLSGGKKLTGTGNELANYISGNTGDNRLRGVDGADRITGGIGGNDIMSGGKGRDVFVFGSGNGHDRIADFENGRDRIDLTTWVGIDRMRDVFDHLHTTAGGDLIIKAGDEWLTLSDTSRSELDKSNFMF